jgi:hypothetical protein
MRRPNVTPEWEGEMRAVTPDELLDLQVEVLEALEEANHPSFAAANADPALRDDASDGQRKAWLAIYGPLTNVLS